MKGGPVDPGLVDALAGLAGADLTALLLEVSARRQARVGPGELGRRYADDRFVRPADLDQRRILALDAHLLARIPAEWDAVELAPVAPLGVCSAIAPVHPNQVLPTFRNTEVLSDCTNVMALECARRRDHAATVRLCTTHRLLRTALPPNPLFRAHFRVLALARAGRDPGGRAFEAEALSEQLGIWFGLLADLPRELEVEPVDLVVAWDARHDGVVERVRPGLPVPVIRDEQRLARSGYYQGLAYKLRVRGPDGSVFELGDGGFVDWVAKLRSDRKERLLIGAIGTERLLRCART